MIRRFRGAARPGAACALLLGLALALAAWQAGRAGPAPRAGAGLLADEISALRGEAGLAPLEGRIAARRAAERHARDLLISGRLSHEGSDGSTAAQRLGREGLTWCRVAENVARGPRDAADVVLRWADSPAHLRNMLGDYDVIGTARDGDIWVAVFVKPC